MIGASFLGRSNYEIQIKYSLWLFSQRLDAYGFTC